MKVFCENCNWYLYIHGDRLMGDSDHCKAPENVDRNMRYNYRHKWRPSINDKTPEYLNKANDCKWYHREWWKFWVKK